MKIIDTSGKKWGTATKGASMHVRPSESVILPEFLDSFKLITLEGLAVLRPDTILCKGINGELWCQEFSTVRAKYDIEKEKDGWSKCTPKAGNSVQFFISTENGWVQGQWGDDVRGVGKNLQEVSKGDAVCRNPKDTTDQWVVRRELFNSTYSVN